ncbi:MAG TPA: metal ABC transporter ATP-binding protein [Firmicutes bacterium]|jgi:ABC-type Mn2+/Zn2+ transport system ATPase subunit|nr:metal ABC transporter ATP-binding protein [Bacillota bacterium]HOQ23509.1 metal ABC transporter ATP-binding protein [Bacillota bacterium]HPT68005.1 metal ABC transporter ATP-binding protein [Bacillota bacterium]
MITDPNKKKEIILSLSGVTLGYPGITALSDVSFAVAKGEFIGIIGPNGSGKSTVLKGILGLLPLLSGEIRVFGTSHLKVARKRIGYVPQKTRNDIDFPALVREVVVMGLYAQIGWVRRVDKSHWRLVDESLALVGMEEYRNRSFRDLSGGQQQRVLIARAIVSRPELLLLDEPTAAVDISAQSSILETLEVLNREQGITMVMVTHDVNEIVHFADKILLLNKGLVAYGQPNEVLTKECLKEVYGDRIFVYDHNGHPHILVGDFA